MGQEVLWLASSEPPASLVTFLRSRGLSLVARDVVTSTSPLRLLWIEASAPPSSRAPNLSGRRIAVMHPDPGNADALAQALRAKGAEVVALSLNPETLHRAETLDPDAVIMEAGDFCSSCWEIVRALWQHPRLRFATVVLATPDLMGSPHVSALDVHDLSFAIAEVSADYARISGEAKREDRFGFELERLGPSRSLRALLEAGRTLRVHVTCGADSFELDLAEHIVVGAQSPAGAAPGEGLLGVHALQLLLAQREGQVEVRAVDHPAHTNVMAPLDTALHLAHESASAVRPSGLHRPLAGQAAAPVAVSSPLNPPLHARTLIGVPAVRLPLPGKSEAPRARGQTPATPSKAAATEPNKPAASAPARSQAPAAASAQPPAAAELNVQVPANANAQPPSFPKAASFARPKLDTPSVRPKAEAPVARPKAEAPAAPERPAPPLPVSQVAPPALIERASSSAPPPRVSTVPYAERASLAPAPVHVAAPRAASSSLPAPGGELPLSAGESGELDALVLDSDWARPASNWQRRVRALLGSRRVLLAGLGLAAVLGLAALGRGLRTPSPTVPSLPVAHAAAEPIAAAPATPPEPPAAEPARQAVADEAPDQAPDEVSDDDGPRPDRVSARRASQLVNQGNAFRRKKMLPSARSRYLEALRSFPGYPRALAGLTQLALAQGSAAEARDFAQQLVQARPGQAAYQLLLGDAQRAAGQLKEARASYTTAQRLGSRDAKDRLDAL
jgi:CheY-like chemotaxis protein